MEERYPLGQMGELKITAGKSVAAGFMLLAAALSLLGLTFFRLRPGAAVTGGLLGAILHYASELWHQAGHARAARHTGYPMESVHLWGLLGKSIYPDDEPPLPDELHVERAMGGPRASAALAVAGGLLALMTRPRGGITHLLAVWLALENWLVFTIGALLPMPFIETDGEVLRRYRDNHRRRMVTIQE